jgi:hypothetical protein
VVTDSHAYLADVNVTTSQELDADVAPGGLEAANNKSKVRGWIGSAIGAVWGWFTSDEEDIFERLGNVAVGCI